MWYNSMLKYQFASFLPNTERVHSHPEGLLPPSAGVRHMSPMQSQREKSKILNPSTALAPQETESQTPACRGYCSPVDERRDNVELPCGQESK